MENAAMKRSIEFIDDWLKYRAPRVDIPGFCVAIAKKGELLFSRSYGYANLEEEIPLETQHLFRIASHSKTITATAIMQLAERKLLDIDAPAANYLNWLSEHRDKRMTALTARQLMCHSAGVIRDGLDASCWLFEQGFPDSARFQKEFMEAELVLDAGRQMKYSNFGYALLGCLVEAVSGTEFNQYAMENIVQPLGLQNTGPDFRAELLPRLVTGYSRNTQLRKRLPLVKSVDTRALSPAAGFYSTAEDLCSYFSAHLQGNGKLLTDKSKQEMQLTHFAVKDASEKDEYALGFSVDYAAKRRLFGHGGGFPGQRSKTMCDSTDGLVVCVLTNCFDAEARTIGKAIYSVFDFFNAEKTCKLDRSLVRSFEGMFSNFACDLGFVEDGDELLAVNLDSWSIFGSRQEMQTLSIVDKDRLKIERCEGYGNEGEIISFRRENGEVGSIKYAGVEMLPSSKYYSGLSQLKIIGETMC